METVRALRGHLGPRGPVVAFSCLLLVLSAAIGLAQPLAARWVLETLARQESLLRPVLILSALVVVAAVTMGFGTFLLLRSAEQIVLEGRRGLVHRILHLTMGTMQRQAPGDLLARVTSDTSLLRQIAIQATSQALLGLVTLVGALVLMAIVDLVLFGVVLAVVIALTFTLGFVMPRVRDASQEVQSSVGELGSQMQRALSAFTMVKASGAEAREGERVAAEAQRAGRGGKRLARLTAVAGTSSGLSTQIAFLVILSVGGARVESGAMSIASLVAFMLYIFYLTAPLLQLINAATYFQAGRAALGRVAEVEQLPLEDGDPEQEAEHRPDWEEPPVSVALRGVTFSYAKADEPALKGVDLEISPGGLAALVGPSGAGKSTIFSLLERFFVPDAGTVEIDGRPTTDWNLGELRAMIAYVQQDTPVMAGTLRENLTYAAPEASAEDLQRVVEACRLESVVRRLDGGLDGQISPGGESLSGGERQRIAIARALLRRPRLLLLDEATSQLDGESEEALRELVRRVARFTTVLVSAHRLSTIRDADRIFVLEAGRLRAVGGHEDLLERDDLYRRLVESQLGEGEAEALPAARPLILWDEDCGFCAWMVALVLRADRREHFRTATIQGEAGEAHLSHLSERERLESWHLVEPNGTVHSAGAALTEVLRRLPGGTPAAALTGRLPGVTERAYAWVAAHRGLLSRPVPAASKKKARARVAQRA